MKDVVDAVVFNYAGYECRMEDGIAHIFRRDLVSDTRNPLNIMIESFEVKNTVTWANVVLFNKIRNVVRMPDFKGIAMSIASSPNDPTFNFVASNLSGRSILNKIVTAGLSSPGKPTTTAEISEFPPRPKRVWIATFAETPAFTRTGYLEVVPLGDSKFIPDESQPIWTLLAWGDSPPEKMIR